jgi:hypothetical protein
VGAGPAAEAAEAGLAEAGPAAAQGPVVARGPAVDQAEVVHRRLASLVTVADGAAGDRILLGVAVLAAVGRT